MAVTHSTALKNSNLDTGFKGAFNTTGRLRCWSGSPPGANAAATGTLLVDFALNATAFAAAAAGASVAGAVSAVNAAASGAIGYFRLCLNADTNGATGSADKRLEGTVTATGGGGDLTFDNINVASGGPVNLSGFTYTHPA